MSRIEKLGKNISDVKIVIESLTESNRNSVANVKGGKTKLSFLRIVRREMVYATGARYACPGSPKKERLTRLSGECEEIENGHLIGELSSHRWLTVHWGDVSRADRRFYAGQPAINGTWGDSVGRILVAKTKISSGIFYPPLLRLKPLHRSWRVRVPISRPVRHEFRRNPFVCPARFGCDWPNGSTQVSCSRSRREEHELLCQVNLSN